MSLAEAQQLVNSLHRYSPDSVPVFEAAVEEQVRGVANDVLVPVIWCAMPRIVWRRRFVLLRHERSDQRGAPTAARVLLPCERTCVALSWEKGTGGRDRPAAIQMGRHSWARDFHGSR